MVQVSDTAGGGAGQTDVSSCDRALLAASNLGVYCCISSFIISSPVLYTVYFQGDATVVGAIGVIFGFFNAVNGIPIADAADAGVLNRRCRRCFPPSRWGRRAPWILIGVPVAAIGAFMMWVPPVRGLDRAQPRPGMGLSTLSLRWDSRRRCRASWQLSRNSCTTLKQSQSRPLLGNLSIVSYTIAGLVAPAIAFTEAPPSEMTGGCCVQPLQRCNTLSGLDCGCFRNATQFVPAMEIRCPRTSNVSITSAFTDSQCAINADDSGEINGIDFSMSNFAIVGAIVGTVTLVSLAAIIPARHTPYGRTDDVLARRNGNIGKSVLSVFRLRSFRWNALANIFANINEQATVQLLPFFLIYVIGSDFRDVGTHNALVAGSTLGAALLGVVIFAWALSRTKSVKAGVSDDALTLPRFHPANFMAIMSLLKLCVSLPLALLSRTYRSVGLLCGSAVMGGIFTGGQSQITAILLGWVMDDDEMANEVAAGGGPRRREGLILSANAMIQHMSFVTVSLIILIWGAIGLDTSLCPSAQPQEAIDAIYISYTVLNGLWLLSYAAALMFYPIRGDKLVELVAYKRRSVGEMATFKASRNLE